MTAGDFMELITPCSGRAELVAIGAHRNGPGFDRCPKFSREWARNHRPGWSHPFAK